MQDQRATDLLERMLLHPGEHVLNVACGTGIVARLAAHRVSPGGSVTGLDLNSGMLSVARSVSPTLDVKLEWREGSAMALPFANASCGVVSTTYTTVKGATPKEEQDWVSV